MLVFHQGLLLMNDIWMRLVEKTKDKLIFEAFTSCDTCKISLICECPQEEWTLSF
jgi:hypothetical protein